MEMLATPTTFDGHPAVQVVITDITAQKELAARLQQAKKTAAIATLAGGIAHEFNNCLTAIMGFSDLALPLLVPDSRPHGHIQQVLLASKRARDLVTQMLVFGRQAGNAKQPISLDILLKETLRILRGRLSERHHPPRMDPWSNHTRLGRSHPDPSSVCESPGPFRTGNEIDRWDLGSAPRQYSARRCSERP